MLTRELISNSLETINGNELEYLNETNQEMQQRLQQKRAKVQQLKVAKEAATADDHARENCYFKAFEYTTKALMTELALLATECKL